MKVKKSLIVCFMEMGKLLRKNTFLLVVIIFLSTHSKAQEFLVKLPKNKDVVLLVNRKKIFNRKVDYLPLKEHFTDYIQKDSFLYAFSNRVPYSLNLSASTRINSLGMHWRFFRMTKFALSSSGFKEVSSKYFFLQYDLNCARDTTYLKRFIFKSAKHKLNDEQIILSFNNYQNELISKNFNITGDLIIDEIFQFLQERHNCFRMKNFNGENIFIPVKSEIHHYFRDF